MKGIFTILNYYFSPGRRAAQWPLATAPAAVGDRNLQLNGAIAVFLKEYEDKGIKINLHCPTSITFVGWAQDIYTIMVNLLDNSLFWIVEKECAKRQVDIEVNKTENGFILDYTDSGPGISSELLESGVIFDPEFSTKPQGKGTGLGLSIAGEAATRNGLTLTAVEKENGAHFILSTDE